MNSSDQALIRATVHIRDHCLCLHAARAARVLARIFDDALRPHGITNGQFSLLNALNGRQPVSMGPVARLLALDRSTLTANLKPLERAGLVSITVDPDDRRSRMLALTPAGRKVLRKTVQVWKRTHARVERSLDVDPDALRAGLRALA